MTVDVYVKFVDVEKMNGSVAGSTSISLGDDGNTYISRYGLHTVSIQIVTGKNALTLLAHEFGHVYHQVPNRAAYQKFYIKMYKNTNLESQEIGHHHTDPSGNKAFEFEKRFFGEYVQYLKTKSNRNEGPVQLIKQISKKFQ
jgi:hypothetical protein